MILLDYFWITTTTGNLPRKSNSRKIVNNRKTGRPMSIKSDNARQWVADALRQLSPLKEPLGSASKPIAITFHVWYKTHMPDLSIELVLDTLQKAGIISDDRYVYDFHALKYFCVEKQGIWLKIAECEHDWNMHPDKF